MITIKQAVKQVLAHMPGNKPFKGTMLMQQVLKIDRNEPISVSQVLRALRDIPYVTGDGKGNYQIKGRKV